MTLIPLMSRRARRILVVVSCTALALTGALPANAGASPASSAEGMPSASGHFAAYSGGDIAPLAESGNITAGSCTYRQAIDNPHISSTAPAAASVHGWWVFAGGTCPATATVSVALQGFWCDSFGCTWITVATGAGSWVAGGGGGNRTTARRTCSSTARLVGWRGLVDVDLDGVADPAGLTPSTIVNLNCVP
jgi:hypothetical protein